MKLIEVYECKLILYQVVNTYIEIDSVQPSFSDRWVKLNRLSWKKAKRQYLSQTLKKLYIDTKKVQLIKIIGPVHQDELDIYICCFIIITNNIQATIGVEATTNTIIAMSLKPYALNLWERFKLKIGYTNRIQQIY